MTACHRAERQHDLSAPSAHDNGSLALVCASRACGSRGCARLMINTVMVILGPNIRRDYAKAWGAAADKWWSLSCGEVL